MVNCPSISLAYHTSLGYTSSLVSFTSGRNVPISPTALVINVHTSHVFLTAPTHPLSVPLATFLPLSHFWQRMAVLYLAHRASSVWSCSWKRAKIPTYVMKNGEERRMRQEETLHAWREQDDGWHMCISDQIRSE